MASKRRSDWMGKVPELSSASPWIRSSGFLILLAWVKGEIFV